MWINAWDCWILCWGRGGSVGIKGAELAFVLLQHDAPAWACHIKVHLPRTTNLFIRWRLKWGWRTLPLTVASALMIEDQYYWLLSVQCSCDNVTAIDGSLKGVRCRFNRQRWGRQDTVDNEDRLLERQSWNQTSETFRDGVTTSICTVLGASVSSTLS